MHVRKVCSELTDPVLIIVMRAQRWVQTESEMSSPFLCDSDKSHVISANLIFVR
jgi:hypothetical protein